MTIPVALTIAGSDSGGGAGIQADLKTFHAFGVFGTTAITAVTVQNTVGVTDVHAVPSDIVRAQIHAIASDFDVRACKTGMLATRELVELVASSIKAERLRNYVLDPVMVATSGSMPSSRTLGTSGQRETRAGVVIASRRSSGLLPTSGTAAIRPSICVNSDTNAIR